MTKYICKNCNESVTQEDYEQNRCRNCNVKGARHFRMVVKNVK